MKRLTSHSTPTLLLLYASRWAATAISGLIAAGVCWYGAASPIIKLCFDHPLRADGVITDRGFYLLGVVLLTLPILVLAIGTAVSCRVFDALHSPEIALELY